MLLVTLDYSKQQHRTGGRGCLIPYQHILAPEGLYVTRDTRTEGMTDSSSAQLH